MLISFILSPTHLRTALNTQTFRVDKRGSLPPSSITDLSVTDSGLVHDPSCSSVLVLGIYQNCTEGKVLVFAVLVKRLRGKSRAILGYPSHHLLYIKSRIETHTSNNSIWTHLTTSISALGHLENSVKWTPLNPSL